MAVTDLPAGIDEDRVKQLSFTVWSYKMGEMVSLMIHLGDQLGLYRAMAGSGPLTAAEVAGLTGLNERLVSEWLHGQAAARIVEWSTGGDDGDGAARFELSAEAAHLLADEHGSLMFAAGAFRGGAEPAVIDRMVESFRTGIGLTYEEQGARAAAGLARMTGPWSRLALVSTIVPALDGVEDKLTTGASVVDVGCGGGVTLLTLAEAFPASRFVGYDPSSIAIEQARERATEAGVTNAEFVQAFAEDLPAGAGFDFVVTFDVLHDMPFPDRAAAAVRAAIADDGTWLVKDIRSTGDFAQDRKNPMLAMFYGFSISSCLQSAMSEEGGMGLGTLGLHPTRAEELVRAAGFGRFTQHDFDDAANLYYEIRP